MIDIEIDRSSNSLIHVASGRSVPTQILPVKQLPSAWNRLFGFDWAGEALRSHVFGLSALTTPGMIEGLLSVNYHADYVYVALVESARHNMGDGKLYYGVGAHLFAFACLESKRLGHGGFVAFDAKTQPRLLQHYHEKLGAQQVGRSSRMIISEHAASTLIEQYYGKED